MNEHTVNRHRFIWMLVICIAVAALIFEISTGNEFAPSITSDFQTGICPSKGNINMPIFVVDFPDTKFDTDTVTASALQNRIFSEDEDDSFASFMKRASYGRLTVSGDVYYYTAKKNIGDYEGEDIGFEDLAMEVLSAFDDEVDFSKYDSDKDGYIDTFTLNVAGNTDYFYGCQAIWWINPDFTVDGKKPALYIINDAGPYKWNLDYYMQEMAHEFGHCMGLPDLYRYEQKDENGNSTEKEGFDYNAMTGDAGTEVMDDMEGDYSAFSKLALGWYKKNDVHVVNTSNSAIQTFTINSNETDGGCVIIPRDPDKEFEDIIKGEYFAIEYDTKEGNMAHTAGIPAEGGIRVLHAESEVYKDEYGGKSFKYNGYSKYYDTSHEGIEILHLVNNGNGYYKAGDEIGADTAGFKWYDADGKETVDTGLTIKIESTDGETATVSVSRDK